MNLFLHGLDSPQIDPGNSLRHKLTEIGEKDRVDVILTNPPFGGEEEKGIQGNFPEDKQTAETALLFLQLIMRKLKRQPTAAGRAARAAVVVPNGTLFGDGVCARIKEELLKDFNLHTIVRLPNGVFAPYTSIPTNLLFFDRSGPTKDVWYYEHPLPNGRKNYTKTQPIQFEEFAPCLEWWPKRKENDRAWKVPAAELLANNCNLDRKNPNAKEDITHLPPEQLAASILEKEKWIIEIVEKIQNPARRPRVMKPWPKVRIWGVLTKSEETINPRPDMEYSEITVRLWGKGVVERGCRQRADEENGRRFVARKVKIIVSRIDSRNGAMGIVPKHLDGSVVTNDFPLCSI